MPQYLEMLQRFHSTAVSSVGALVCFDRDGFPISLRGVLEAGDPSLQGGDPCRLATILSITHLAGVDPQTSGF